MHTPLIRSLVPFFALALVVAIAGCSPDPQEQYEDATQALKEARQARNESQEKLDDKKEELAELRANLNESEANLQAARKKVQDASEKVNKTVNDEVLFRTVQRELLDKKHFEEAAISVGVQDRVVTLTGNVPNEQTHKRAVQTARDQAGVKKVVDSLQVRDKPSAPDNKKPADDKPATSGGSGGSSKKPAQPADEGSSGAKNNEG